MIKKILLISSIFVSINLSAMSEMIEVSNQAAMDLLQDASTKDEAREILINCLSTFYNEEQREEFIKNLDNLSSTLNNKKEFVKLLKKIDIFSHLESAEAKDESQKKQDVYTKRAFGENLGTSLGFKYFSKIMETYNELNSCKHTEKLAFVFLSLLIQYFEMPEVLVIDNQTPEEFDAFRDIFSMDKANLIKGLGKRLIELATNDIRHTLLSKFKFRDKKRVEEFVEEFFNNLNILAKSPHAREIIKLVKKFLCIRNRYNYDYMKRKEKMAVYDKEKAEFFKDKNDESRAYAQIYGVSDDICIVYYSPDAALELLKDVVIYLESSVVQSSS